jgi:hypothetical protein
MCASVTLDWHSCVLTSKWLHRISKGEPGQAVVGFLCPEGGGSIINYIWFLYFKFRYDLTLSPPTGRHCSRQFVRLAPLVLFAYFIIIIKVKKKCPHYTPWRRLGRQVVQLLLIHNLGTRWGWAHAPAVLYPRGKDHPYPLYRRLGGPQSRSGRRG